VAVDAMKLGAITVKLFLGAKHSLAPHVFEEMPNANNKSLATGDKAST
jgi:hypothetical protein